MSGKYLIEKDSFNLVEGLEKEEFNTHKHNASDINAGTLAEERLPTVPINKGGTGATDAETARTNLGAAAQLHTHSINDITGAIGKFTTLWENQYSGENFSGSDVSIQGLNDYNLLMIVCQSNSVQLTSFVYVRNYVSIHVDLANTYMQGGGAGYLEVESRAVNVRANEGIVRFSDANSLIVENANTYVPTCPDNSVLIPIAIYGANI